MDAADEAVFMIQHVHEQMMNNSNDGYSNGNQNKEQSKPGANNYSWRHNGLSVGSKGINGGSPARFLCNHGNENRSSNISNYNSNTNNKNGNGINPQQNNQSYIFQSSQTYAHPPNDDNYGYGNSRGSNFYGLQLSFDPIYGDSISFTSRMSHLSIYIASLFLFMLANHNHSDL